jgi:hypothetical protein
MKASIVVIVTKAVPWKVNLENVRFIGNIKNCYVISDHNCNH